MNVPELWPCPKCGDPDGPTIVLRAGSYDVRFVICLKCRHRIREAVASPALTASTWNNIAEAAARREEQRALRQHSAYALRRDERFVAAVVERYVRYGALSDDGGVRMQIMRMPVDGVEREVNIRAFVDSFLMPTWPELARIAFPECVVWLVLHDAGLGVREVAERGSTGEWIGRHKRSEPKVGREVAA